MSQMDSKPSQSGPINMNMNNINMVGAGTPGGMEHGAPPRGGSNNERQLLNTYIYDYFIKNDMLDCAKAILRSPGADILFEGNYRPSPGRPKQEGDMNGVDEDAMDSSDDRQNGDDPKNIKDFPPPKVPPHQNSFLFEWWACFMDIYCARNKGPASQAANAYVNHAQVGCTPVRNAGSNLLVNRRCSNARETRCSSGPPNT
jgi:hypothetical protein